MHVCVGSNRLWNASYGKQNNYFLRTRTFSQVGRSVCKRERKTQGKLFHTIPSLSPLSPLNTTYLFIHLSILRPVSTPHLLVLWSSQRHWNKNTLYQDVWHCSLCVDSPSVNQQSQMCPQWTRDCISPINCVPAKKRFNTTKYLQKTSGNLVALVMPCAFIRQDVSVCTTTGM